MEKQHTINGVSGRLTRIKTPGVRAAGCWDNQTWKSEPRAIKGYGANGRISVEIRHDDECKNGHNSFAITATVVTTESLRRCDIAAGGCLHEDIARVFPELAHLIQWHLFDTRGPMHYIANTLYFAGDRDCHGLRKGKARELDAARRAACWPEATDEQLSLPREELQALLEARLPALIERFRADVEAIGFSFVAPDSEVQS